MHSGLGDYQPAFVTMNEAFRKTHINQEECKGMKAFLLSVKKHLIILELLNNQIP